MFVVIRDNEVIFIPFSFPVRFPLRTDDHHDDDGTAPTPMGEGGAGVGGEEERWSAFNMWITDNLNHLLSTRTTLLPNSDQREYILWKRPATKTHSLGFRGFYACFPFWVRAEKVVEPGRRDTKANRFGTDINMRLIDNGGFIVISIIFWSGNDICRSGPGRLLMLASGSHLHGY